MNDNDATLEQRELIAILTTAIWRHQILTYASPRPDQLLTDQEPT